MRCTNKFLKNISILGPDSGHCGVSFGAIKGSLRLLNVLILAVRDILEISTIETNNCRGTTWANLGKRYDCLM
jgi:hypothetical protein